MIRVFVSDLHLSAERPSQVELFFSLLSALKNNTQLYILGDLFEIWLGDDDDTPPNKQIINALAGFSDSGGELSVMRGNRDFLFGEDFVTQSGATLLDDYATIEIDDSPVLLTHGDLLCTKDVKYQAFRQFVRDENNQREFLAHPLARRRLIAQQTQTGTKASMLEKDDFIMDVEQSTVERVMQSYAVHTLIHGHTHRPQDHDFQISGVTHQRMVLGDWYDQDSLIYWRDGQYHRSSAHGLITALGSTA